MYGSEWFYWLVFGINISNYNIAVYLSKSGFCRSFKVCFTVSVIELNCSALKKIIIIRRYGNVTRIWFNTNYGLAYYRYICIQTYTLKCSGRCLSRMKCYCRTVWMRNNTKKLGMLDVEQDNVCHMLSQQVSETEQAMLHSCKDSCSWQQYKECLFKHWK